RRRMRWPVVIALPPTGGRPERHAPQLTAAQARPALARLSPCGARPMLASHCCCGRRRSKPVKIHCPRRTHRCNAIVVNQIAGRGRCVTSGDVSINAKHLTDDCTACESFNSSQVLSECTRGEIYRFERVQLAKKNLDLRGARLNTENRIVDKAH